MKYIKTYEKRRDLITKRNTFKNEYSVSEYLVFKFTRYSYEHVKECAYLCLSKILKSEVRDGQHILLTVKIIDYYYEIGDIDVYLLANNNQITFDVYPSASFAKYLISHDIKLATHKFETLKKNAPFNLWEVKRDTEKYNL